MPNFWQFPTVSMGLGPLMSIYQASFLKYLQRRGFANTEDRHVWTFCGDGELGEPESLGALLVGKKMREHLKNVRHVIVNEIHEIVGSKRGIQLS